MQKVTRKELVLFDILALKQYIELIQKQNDLKEVDKRKQNIYKDLKIKTINYHIQVHALQIIKKKSLGRNKVTQHLLHTTWN